MGDKNDTRVVLHLHPELAPIKVAVMPLSKKEPLTNLAQEIHATLRKHWMTQYDQTGGAIGKRYRRQDEIGTPLCVTVDFDSLEDQRRDDPRARHDGPGPRADRRTGARACSEKLGFSGAAGKGGRPARFVRASSFCRIRRRNGPGFVYGITRKVSSRPSNAALLRALSL